MLYNNSDSMTTFYLSRIIMSNIATVRTALAAEIKNARDGIAFYTKRIVELENLQQQLGRLDFAETTVPAAKQTGKATSKLKTGLRDNMASDGATDPAASDAGQTGKIKLTSKLPATKTAFWQGLLTQEPMSNKDMLSAALIALKVRPTPGDLQKLKQRLANFITTSAKDGTFQSEGSGRDRRFFALKSA